MSVKKNVKKNKKNNRIIKIASRITEILDLPEDVVGRSLKITMVNNEHLFIENHGGVYELFEHNVKLNGNGGIVSVRGDGLVLSTLSEERLYISGKIKGIDVE